MKVSKQIIGELTYLLFLQTLQSGISILHVCALEKEAQGEVVSDVFFIYEIKSTLKEMSSLDTCLMRMKRWNIFKKQ